jgi:death-on-curing protein
MPSKPAKAIRYLSASELYNINDAITDGHTFVRDLNLLNSAARRPSLYLFGEPQFPTLADKAAALLESLAYHHLFADGNKRTAAHALNQFMRLNGYRLTWDEATQSAFILEVAQGRLDTTQIAAALEGYIVAVDAS